MDHRTIVSFFTCQLVWVNRYFIAADDAEAKTEVSALVKSLGFDAVDAGPLSNSRFIEPIGEMNIHFGYFLGWGPVSAPMWPRI